MTEQEQNKILDVIADLTKGLADDDAARERKAGAYVASKFAIRALRELLLMPVE